MKDLDWLKKEFNDLFNGKSILTVGKSVIDEILDQLDKTETLSQTWIDENHFETENWDEDLFKSDGETIDHTPHIKVIAVQDLPNLIAPQQELPTIPKFVAEFLIGKEDYMLYELLDDEWLYKEHDRVAKWLYDNDELTNRQREIDLVMARDRGYTIEKEQLYFAKIKGHENISSDDKYWNYCITDESLDIGDNKVHADVLAEYVLNATKDEWRNLGINDDNADFVEVEELED